MSGDIVLRPVTVDEAMGPLPVELRYLFGQPGQISWEAMLADMDRALEAMIAGIEADRRKLNITNQVLKDDLDREREEEQTKPIRQRLAYELPTAAWSIIDEKAI